MQKWEKQLIENKHELDIHSPPENMFDKIQSNMIAKNEKNYRKFLAIAASIILFISVTLWLFQPWEINTKKTTEWVSEYQEAEIFFTQTIQQQRQFIETSTEENAEINQSVLQSIHELDSLYHDLKNQLETAPNKEILVNAMILNLKTQMELLQEQMEIIHEKNETTKNQKHENKQV